MEKRKVIINYLLGVDIELFNTYHYVHELRRLLKENQIEKFNHKLFSIHLSDVCPKLRPVIRTLRRLAAFIENTMTYSNLTNGPLEGINNKIKLIKRYLLVIEIMIICNRIIITSRLFASTTKRD